MFGCVFEECHGGGGSVWICSLFVLLLPSCIVLLVGALCVMRTTLAVVCYLLHRSIVIYFVDMISAAYKNSKRWRQTAAVISWCCYGAAMVGLEASISSKHVLQPNRWSVDVKERTKQY